MKFADATNLNRKSGVAQWRDLRCAFPSSNSEGRVPHISLVFREMWDTTGLSLNRRL